MFSFAAVTNPAAEAELFNINNHVAAVQKGRGTFMVRTCSTTRD
jgi:hypothetical protein